MNATVAEKGRDGHRRAGGYIPRRRPRHTIPHDKHAGDIRDMRMIRSSLLALPALAAAAPAMAHPGGHHGGLEALAYHLHPHGLEIVLGALAVVVGGLAYGAWRKNNDE